MIILCRLSWGIKIKSIGIIAILLGIFILGTIQEYQKETKTSQFSAFAGWQLASNSLYGYAHSQQEPATIVPVKFQKLHQVVNRHMDSLNALRERPDREVAVYYQWHFSSPLRTYMNQTIPLDSSDRFFIQWAKMGPLFGEYGRYIIGRHPGSFIRYYLWPNFKKYYVPPAKFMGYYNMKNETVAPSIADWFSWKNNKVSTHFNQKEIYLPDTFRILSPIINLIFLTGFIAFIMLEGKSRSDVTPRKILWLTMLVWVVNMLFSVFSAPIELRYQLFPLMVTTCFMWLLLTDLINYIRIGQSQPTLLRNPKTVIN